MMKKKIMVGLLAAALSLSSVFSAAASASQEGTVDENGNIPQMKTGNWE